MDYSQTTEEPGLFPTAKVIEVTRARGGGGIKTINMAAEDLRKHQPYQKITIHEDETFYSPSLRHFAPLIFEKGSSQRTLKITM